MAIPDVPTNGVTTYPDQTLRHAVLTILRNDDEDSRFDKRRLSVIWDELERRRRLGIATLTDRDHTTRGLLALDVNPLWIGRWISFSPSPGVLVEFQLVRYQVDADGVVFASDDTTAYHATGTTTVRVCDDPWMTEDTIQDILTT